MTTNTNNFPKITVRTTCTCGAKRWFSCTCSYVIAEYQCHRDLDGTGRVHPDDAAAVRKLHPNEDLIYID